MRAPTFTSAPATSAAIRVQSGRYIAAPFNAQGWQTEPAIDVGPASEPLANVAAHVRELFDVTEIAGPR